MPGAVSRAQLVAVHQRRAALLQARIDGRSFDDIAEDPAFGYNGSASAARKDFSRTRRAALEAEKEMADLWTAQQVDRLEYYLQCLQPKVDKGEPRAIEVAVMISKQISKLLGIEAPVRTEVTVTDAPSAQDLELMEMVNEAKTRIAAEEAQLRGEQ